MRSNTRSDKNQRSFMRLQGWIFDLYPSRLGMKLWLITPERTRHLLIDRFEPSFYAAGAR